MTGAKQFFGRFDVCHIETGEEDALLIRFDFARIIDYVDEHGSQKIHVMQPCEYILLPKSN